uniref:Uncharacterized protein n=1 Tax=Timema douglasi TaxID=61478 RepID=A0A7R8VJR6_TIMDO|nr:unnamed protein product [Timema douglasi]
MTDNSVPSLPSIIANPAGRVPINAKKLKDLATFSNYLIGYNFYTILQGWPRMRVQVQTEDSDDGTNDQ